MARRQAAARRNLSAARPGSAGVGNASLRANHVSSAQADWRARWGRAWRTFWHGGNPMLRNLATAGLALTLFVAGADSILTQPSTPTSPALFVMEQERLAAPVAPEIVPADEAVEADALEVFADAPSDEDETAMAAMAAPALGTPALVEGEEGEAVTLELDAEPMTLQAVPPEAESETAEGGFGDPGAGLPQMIQGSETGSGGADGPGLGMGGGNGMGGGDDLATLPPARFPIPTQTELPVPAEDEADAAPMARMAAQEDAPASPESAFQAGMEAGMEAPATDLVTESVASEVSAPEEPEIAAAFALDAELGEDDTAQAALTDEDGDPGATAERVAILAAPTTAPAPREAETMTVETATAEVIAPEGADVAGALDAAQPLESGRPELRILRWIQWGLLVFALTFSALWWRSRDRQL